MPIRTKLTILFIVIALVPSLLIGTVTFLNYEKSLKADQLANVRNIAIFKADKIEGIFFGFKTHLEIAQQLYNVKQYFPVLTQYSHDPSSPQFRNAKNILDGQLPQIQATLGLSDVLLVNSDGKIVYSSNPKHFSENFLRPLPDPGQKSFHEGKAKVYFSDIFLRQGPPSRFAMLLTAPVFDSQGTGIGVIAFDVDMAPIYKLIQDVTGLGKSGETLIGKKFGDQAVFLNPLRHDPQAALQRRVTLGSKVGTALQQACQGRDGAGIVLDYRGKRVIGAWHHIPLVGWGMVAKIDTQEAFAAIDRLKTLVDTILILVFFLASIMAIVVAKTISGPLKKLSQGAAIIGAGNLDHQIGTDLKDEVGQLSRAFDKMTQDLKKVMASRDELNREIAERKLAEVSLIKSKKEWEQTFDSVPDLIAILDTEHKIVRANKAMARALGTTVDHCRGLNCFSCVHGLADPPEFCPHARTLRDGQEHVAEVHESRLNGDFLVSTTPLFDEHGRITGTVHVARNITERKQAERAIRESETRLNRAQEIAQLGSWELDLAGNRLSWSNETYRLFGLHPQEFEATYEAFLEAVHPDDRAAVDAAYVSSLREGRDVYEIEHRIIRKDTGEVRVVHEKCEHIRDESGKIIRSLGMVQDITERKQIEETLQAKEKQIEEQFNELVQIYKYSPVGLFAVDRDCRFLRVNEHLAKFSGKTMEEHLGHQLADVVPPEMAQELMRTWQEVFTKGEAVVNVEIKGTLANLPGVERYWLANFYPYKSSTGAVVGLMGAVVEISDRKAAEETLRQTRDYLEKLINYANAPIICWDRNFKITRFNHAFEQLTDHKAAEVLGQDLSILFPEATKQESLDKITQALRGESWDDVEIPILRKDWEVRTVLWNSANIYAEDGKTLVATIAQGQDITSRKMVEEALRKSRDELEFRVNQRTVELRQANEVMEKIFSTAHFSIVYLDSQFRFIRVNKAYAQACGCPLEFFAGKNHFDLYPHAENKQIFENVVKMGQPYSVFAKPFSFPDHPEWGVTYWDWSLMPVKDAAGSVEGLVFCLVDVTKREMAEQELERTQNQLIEAKRLSDIGTLAATVAHELRNPLAAIHMAAYNMHRKAKSPLLDSHLDVIERKINESDQIINNLLFYSRIRPPKYEVVNIYSIVEECLVLAQNRFLGETVSMVQELERLKAVSIDADSIQLKEVFSNIVNNAFDAMRARSGRIVVSGGAEGPWVRIQVSDEGSGIEPEDLEKIFDPFFTTKAQGTGLGLTVCKQIVTFHGGTIEIKSEKGRGTTVVVQLPAHRGSRG